MRFTPLEIQNHRFATRWRGLDPAEVESFVRMVSEDYESLLQERDGLKKRVEELEERVAELSANEKALQETLVSAQQLSEDLKRSARKEADALLSEAEVKAEKVLGAAHRRASRIGEDVREMRLLRTRLADSIRRTIETHLKLLEGLEADPPELEVEAEPEAPRSPGPGAGREGWAARPARAAGGEA